MARTSPLASAKRGRSIAAWRLVSIGLGSTALYGVLVLIKPLIQRDSFDRSGLLLQVGFYSVISIGLFALYGWLIAICRRGELESARVRRLALGLPVLFNLILLFSPPAMSIDVMSYISHGYIENAGGNAYVEPSSSVAGSNVGSRLESFGWRPVHPVSPYGPLWSQIEATASREGDVSETVTVFKAIAIVFSLGSAVLIWLILGNVHPQHRLFGTLLYLWNPLIVIELAGEGHNDAAVVFFVLLSLTLTIRQRPVGGILATNAGILTKYLPLLFVPMQAVYLWRTRQDSRHLVRRVIVGITAALVLAVLAFAPRWAGIETFEGVRLTGQLGNTGSTPTLLLHGLSRAVSSSGATVAVSVVTMVGLAVWLWWQAKSVIDSVTLLRACAVVGVVYLLVASPSFWPWYAVLPVALMALVPEAAFLTLLLAVSIGARLVAPLDALYVAEVIDRGTFLLTTWTMALGLPLMILGVLMIRSRAPGMADLGEADLVRRGRDGHDLKRM
jgi:alpha-1,6-mannosyltransferase